MLRNYHCCYATVRWFRSWGGWTRGREGFFAFLRLGFLTGLYVVAFYLPPAGWEKISLTIIAAYLIADMIILPTSIAFGGNIPAVPPVRLVVFVFLNYISIAMAFGVLYVSLCRASFNIVPGLIDLAFFSFSTMTALGLGDIIPARQTILVRFMIVSEVLFGLYFWAVLVGVIISWTAREAQKK